MTRKSFHRRNVAPALEERTDAELLSCFVATGDEVAFATLVARYEQMIWNVCWRVLHHRQDAEASRQQTFMVLIQKAETLHNGEPLTNWLPEVAFQEARNIREEKWCQFIINTGSFVNK